MRNVKKLAVVAVGLVFLPVAAWAQYLYQEHYQWRNDDGSESSATWKANADTAMTGVTRGANIRLRFSEVNKYTGTYAFPVTARLEYSMSTSGPWTPVSIAGDGTTAFEMTTTSGYADGDSTTAQLAGAGTFVAGKCVESPNNTSANVAINLSQYSNFEYCFKATAKAKGGTTYYFRLAGFSYQSYTIYAQLTMAAGEANEPPVIKSPLTAQGSVVAAFSYAILASGSEPITYGASGLPTGLAFDGTNRITGTPASVGTFNVRLTATNAWGGDAETLALTVFANQPPVASNQTANVVEGGEVLIYLAWGDPDTPLRTDHTFTILSGPSQGTLQSYNARNNTTAYPDYWYYRAAVGTGTQNFTWKCRDKDNDSNVATCTINVTANTAPVAKDTSATVSGGLRTGVSLSVTHSDAGQTLTYTLVSGPSHGTLEPNATSSYWYYTPAGGYVGWDSFTWCVSDGVANSGVATVTINVGMSVPVPQNQTVCAATNVSTIIPAYFTGGGGYTSAVAIVSGVRHGTVTVTNGTSFRYVPATGYLGPDYFTWTMNYGESSLTGTTATVTCSIWVKEGGTDWPTFRADAYRSGVSFPLPDTLYLQWRRNLPESRQAWPGASANQVWPGAQSSGGYFSTQGKYMNIDQNYEPIAADGKVFMGSNRDDCMLAYDAATGAELWRAYVDGPIRTAPLYSNGKVYAGADDSFIYCWNANTGALVWKKQAVSGGGGSKLARRKVFGNMRMVSQWPVRGGLMLVEGKLYFASGVWPVEGNFVGALNPETGGILWLSENSMTSPQGYLVRQYWDQNSFYVPQGKTRPSSFPLYSGSVAGPYLGSLDTHPSPTPGYEWAVLASAATLDPGVIPLEGGRDFGSSWVVYNTGSPYPTPPHEWPLAITAGSKTYSASEVTGLGVVGTVSRIIAANGRLFVLTKGNPSSLYCFGGSVQSSPTVYPLVTTAIASSNDVWKTRATRILTESGVTDKGVALVLGIGSGRLVDELLLQSSLHVVVVDPDTNKVQELRMKLSNAGLHGARASVLLGDPMDCGLPSYIARLIVSEDVATAGWSNGVGFARGVFKPVRPYGGEAWLFTASGQHTTFSGWVASAGLENASVARDSANEFSVLTRAGALPGAVEWTAANGAVTNGDRAVRGPIGVLWYGDTTADYAAGGHWGNPQPDVVNGRVVANTGRSVDAYSGIVLSGSQTYSGAKTLAASAYVIEETPGSQRRSPLFGLRERGYPTSVPCGGGACSSYDGQYGSIRSEQSIYKHDIGAIPMPFKARCSSDGIIPANGLVVVAQEEGCNCSQTLQTAAAFGHDPDAENWATYSYQRLGQTVEEVPIMRLGVNFGAPAEHMGADGKLWVRDNGGLVGAYEPVMAQRYYHHSVRMLSSEGPAWVAASVLKGATKIRIPVAWTPVAQWTQNAPAIDGNLSDSCWDGASPTLLNRNGTGSGDCWFRYDGTNLYVGAVVWNPGDYGESYYWNHPWTVYLSDRRQVTSDGVVKGLWLTVSRLGEKYGSVQVGRANPSPWAGVWSGAMVWSGTEKCVVEYAIPWSTLAAEGFEREKLLINVVGPQFAQIRGDGTSFYHDYLSGQVADRLGGYYVPLSFGQVTGLLGNPKPYKVRLHFAETEGALAGARVFDVKLQGSTVLTDFDVFAAAGGANRGIVREFTGVSVGNELVVEFTPKVGDPVISGVELEAQFTLPNQAPVLLPRPDPVTTVAVGYGGLNFTLDSETVEPEGDNMTYAWERDGVPLTGVDLGTAKWYYNPGNTNVWYTLAQSDVGEHRVKVTANDGHGGVTSYEWTLLVTGSNSLPDVAVTYSPSVGGVPLAVSFDASGSVDTNGLIVSYAWDYGDGTTGSGVTANHTYTQAGSYNVRLTVTDNEGARRSTNVMIYAIAPPGPASPQITSALTANGTVGQAFSYMIMASGTQPITYGASGLPAGLSRSDATISGTPTTAGTNNVTLTATNSIGSDTKTLVLTVDAGVDAYGIPNAWKIQYFGSASGPGSGALDDPDHDGMCNWKEYTAGTIPTNPASVLRIGECRWDGGSDFVIVWSSVTGKYYAIRGTTNLLLGFPVSVTSHVPGIPPVNCHTVAVDQAGQRFYRVVVEP